MGLSMQDWMKINKSINRETTFLSATKRGRLCDRSEIQARNLIVSLNPDETISFRVKGTRQRYALPLGVAYVFAQREFILNRYNEKMKEYKLKKAAGLRAVRPKKPWLIPIK